MAETDQHQQYPGSEHPGPAQPASAQPVSEGAGSLGLLQDRYRLDAVIGSGGMSLVYRATDTLLARTVAIKVFTSRATDDEELRRQESEATMLASLSHHGLVTLFDAGVDISDPAGPQVYLVMELIEGHDLKSLLTEHPFTLKQVAHFGFDLAEALEYVHSKGVVHRDIKPANVLLVDWAVDRRPRVKLTDFGIATLAGHTAVLEEEYTTGTAAYLSPEQANGEEVGQASDVYSLGLVLLECITGRVAFPGSVLDSALARLERDPFVPTDLPVEWQTILTAMTARDPAARPRLEEIVLTFRQLAIGDSGRHRFADEATEKEASRLAAVRALNILDTPEDSTFDRITGVAARVFDMPIAIVSIVDADRIWFKSHFGLDAREIGRDAGMCATAVLGDGAYVVPDTRTDARTAANPLVTGPLGIRFYAGVPLVSADGFNIGTLCVLDTKPRTMTDADVATLSDLGEMVSHEINLRQATRRAVLAQD